MDGLHSTSGNSAQESAVGILDKYYSTVKPLRQYLDDIFKLSSGNVAQLANLSRNGDKDGFLDLLTTCYVAVKQTPRLPLRVYPATLEIHEVIDLAQSRVFRSKRGQNVITSGYRLAQNSDDVGKTGMARTGITNFFVNTIINVFHGPEWQTLLQRIGDDAMIHLLSETSLFVSLPNGCLCQVAGEPLIHLAPATHVAISSKTTTTPSNHEKMDNGKKRSLPEPEAAAQKSKSKQQKIPANRIGGQSQIPQLSAALRPADVSFTRARLFYTKPNYIPHTKYILVGLPLKHILNRLAPSYDRSPLKDVEDARKLAEKTRHISKYVFARQYNFSNPFSSPPAKGSAFKYGDYMDRETEIKNIGTCKTPKRLKEVLPLLEKMIKRHQKCGYVPLRNVACPSKITTTDQKQMDDSIILELMSENSIQLQSQRSLPGANTSLDSNGSRIQPMGMTQAQQHARNKPKFVEFACSHTEVYRYVDLITNTVIPSAFWGSSRNLKVVLTYVKELITCRRYEIFSVHHVLQNFSTADCDWLIPPGPGAQKQTRVSVSDALKRREILEDFMFWYFDSFVLPLLKTTFYITESSAFRNHVLYFRHDDWHTLCSPLIERLTTVTFEKLTDDEAAEILRQRTLGFSFIRLLPKDTGVRPIVNLRRKKTVSKGSSTFEQSINQILQAAFSILTYEKTNQPKLLGASIFSPDEIHLKLKKFKASLPKSATGALPQLYFVKLDVQACFDTIEQTKLLQILREIISEDAYMMQKYGQINTSMDRVRRTYTKKAIPEDDHPHFIRYATDLANVLRNTIFVDQVVYPISKKAEILDLLEQHITENIVKIGKSYYKQTVGIPQGSVLSSILCSFFYGNLEKKFSKFMVEGEGLLLRLIDDYLYITTSQPNARDFLRIMQKGHPEYGCSISPDKTLTNFDAGDGSLNVIDPGQRTFPWCGFAIGMRDLSVSVDYTRYHGSGLRSTLTIERGRRPGSGLSHKLMQLAKAKSHPIYSDRELNSEYSVYLNIYQNLALTALKLLEYLKDWGTTRRTNSTFLQGVIQRTILYNYTSIRGQGRRKNGPEQAQLKKEAVLWLGNHAFHYVFSRKPSRYSLIVKALEAEVRRSKNRRFLRQFQPLVTEGQAGLAQILP